MPGSVPEIRTGSEAAIRMLTLPAVLLAVLTLLVVFPGCGGTRVPDVVGLNYQDAEKVLEKAGCSIELDPYQKQEIPGAYGNLRISSQDPETGTRVEAGNLVTVKLDVSRIAPREPEDNAVEQPADETARAPTPAPRTPTICLDPGHSVGGPGSEIDPATGLDVADNSGAQGELAAMWELALKTRDVLAARGYNVILTKQAPDQYVNLRTRADIGNQADIMVRLHYDFNLHAIIFPGEGQYKARAGHTVYVDPGVSQRSEVLAHTLLPHLQGVGITRVMHDCGGTSNNTGPAFVGSVLSTVPVVLIENNPSVVRDNPQGQQSVAESLAAGIDAYFQAVGQAH